MAMVQHHAGRGKPGAKAEVIGYPSGMAERLCSGGRQTTAMLQLTREQEAAFGLELAAKRQEHADLDAAIHTLSTSGYSDQMLIQRMKKRKLALKDRIMQLENFLLPDIIA